LNNGRKKIKLEEQAISEFLIADTDSESGDEAGDVVKNILRKKMKNKKKKKNNNNKQPPQKSNHRLPQGRNTT
jgi:hypothetical protein